MNGGTFSIEAKPGAPGSWVVTWKDETGTAQGSHVATWAALEAAAFWQDCADATDEAALAAKGMELSHFLLSGAAGDAWEMARTAWSSNPSTGQNIWQTGLAIQDDTLDALPWEIMWRDNEPAWMSPNETFCRVRSPKKGAARLPVADGWPWRLLILKGALPEDSAVRSEEETMAIHRAWWDLRHETLIQSASPASQAELEALVEKLQPHVLHFIGHGEAGALRFDAGGKSWTWDSTDIAIFFKGRCPVPHLVWLNACQTASPAGPVGSARDHRSLQRVFFDLGVPVVAGMGGDIDGALAAMQAAAFYEKLAAGLPPDAALAAARQKARTWRKDASRSKGITFHQPYLVSLLQSTQPLPALPIAPATAEFEQVIRDTPPFKEVGRWFVDRHRTRMHLFADTLDTAGRMKKNGKSRLVVLHGLEQTGKSWLLHCALKALASRGWLVRCHEMNGADAPDWLGILKLMRHGQAPEQRPVKHEHSELLAALPGKHFEAFDHAVSRIEAKPAAVTDEDITATFEAFITGLENCGKAKGCQGVVVALDQLQGAGRAADAAGGPSGEAIRPPWLKIWAESFFKPLGDGRPIPVLAFVGLTDDLLKDSPLDHEAWKRRVDCISLEEVPVALTQFFEVCLGKEWLNQDLRKLAADQIGLVVTWAKDGVSPAQLKEFYTGWAKNIGTVTGKILPEIDDP